MKTLKQFITESVINEAKLTPEHETIINFYKKLKELNSQNVEVGGYRVSTSGKTSDCYVEIFNKSLKNNQEGRLLLHFSCEKNMLTMDTPLLELIIGKNRFKFSIFRINERWEPSFKSKRKVNKSAGRISYIIEESSYQDVMDAIIKTISEVSGDKITKLFNHVIDNYQNYYEQGEAEYKQVHVYDTKLDVELIKEYTKECIRKDLIDNFQNAITNIM
jgi:hypothetical protein